jgi:hypothetical protein
MAPLPRTVDPPSAGNNNPSSRPHRRMPLGGPERHLGIRFVARRSWTCGPTQNAPSEFPAAPERPLNFALDGALSGITGRGMPVGVGG